MASEPARVVCSVISAAFLQIAFRMDSRLDG